MIKIHKRVDNATGSHHECATTEEAHALFDADSSIVIARCSTDEEMLSLMSAVNGKAKTTVEKGLLDTVMIWAPSMRQVDGDGWRIMFEQQETLTVKGIQKQQAAQMQQAAQAQATMRAMIGGGGGGNGLSKRR